MRACCCCQSGLVNGEALRGDFARGKRGNRYTEVRIWRSTRDASYSAIPPSGVLTGILVMSVRPARWARESQHFTFCATATTYPSAIGECQRSEEHICRATNGMPAILRDFRQI